MSCCDLPDASANKVGPRPQIGLLLLLIVPGYVPSPSAPEFWLRTLVHDDRTNRVTAVQALECILKLSKIKRKRVTRPVQNIHDTKRPGIIFCYF